MGGFLLMQYLNQLLLHDILLKSSGSIKGLSLLTRWEKANQWKKQQLQYINYDVSQNNNDSLNK